MRSVEQPYIFPIAEASAAGVDLTDVNTPIGEHVYDDHVIDRPTFDVLVRAVLKANTRGDMSDLQGKTIADFRREIINCWFAPELGAQVLRDVFSYVETVRAKERERLAKIFTSQHVITRQRKHTAWALSTDA